MQIVNSPTIIFFWNLILVTLCSTVQCFPHLNITPTLITNIQEYPQHWAWCPSPSPSFRNCRNDVSDVNDVGIQLSLHRGAASSLSLLRLTEAGSDACNRHETTDRRGKCGPRMFELSDTSRSGSRSVRLGNTEIRKEEGYDVINEVNLHSSYSLKLLFTWRKVSTEVRFLINSDWMNISLFQVKHFPLLYTYTNGKKVHGFLCFDSVEWCFVFLRNNNKDENGVCIVRKTIINLIKTIKR